MYVWAAFEAKSPPTCQDLATFIPITHSCSMDYGAPFWFKTSYSPNIFFFLLLGLSDEQREQVQKCLKSRRVIQEDEILRLSKQVSVIPCQ